MSSGKAQVGVVLFLAVAGIGAYLAFGAPLPIDQQSTGPIAQGQPVSTATGSAQSNIQLDSLQFVTPTPVPPTPTQVPVCSIQGNSCGGGACISDGFVTTGEGVSCCPGVPIEDTEPFVSNGQTYYRYQCDFKPVIYLYSSHEEHVDVSVSIPGYITESIPLYPSTGWRHITAEPDGTLYYQGKSYSELFYETAQTLPVKPSRGIIVTKEQIPQTLTTLSTKLGLNTTEQQELVSFWVPKLINLSTPYIFISYYQGEQKQRIDHVTVSPKPDTSIEFIFYFKPLQHFQPVRPLILPQNPPTRIGFTEVEWGGIIDY